MYLWDNSSKTTKSLFPISGNKLINMSQSSVEIFGNVKFKGNSKYVGPLGLYKMCIRDRLRLLRKTSTSKFCCDRRQS